MKTDKNMKRKLTKEDLTKKLQELGELSENQRKSIICALIGHSRIQENFMGYHDCARCGERMGDTLAGFYPYANFAVVRGHNCEQCKKNFEECTWEDRIFVRDPFVKDFLERQEAPYLETL